MLHRESEQPTLFELTACNEFEPLRGLPPQHAALSATPKSDSPVLEGNVSPTERRVFRAVSPLASMSLHEVCAACGREISGSGFVILDYEELGAFCLERDQIITLNEQIAAVGIASGQVAITPQKMVWHFSVMVHYCLLPYPVQRRHWAKPAGRGAHSTLSGHYRDTGDASTQ